MPGLPKGFHELKDCAGTVLKQFVRTDAENDMAITPKNLNETNSAYGPKQFPNAWRDASLVLLSKVVDHYQNGGYRLVIDKGKEYLNNRIKQFYELSQLREDELTYLYLMGKSYRILGMTDNAIGCFHLVYSQDGFKHHMLTTPHDFPAFIGKAREELDDIAREKGESYVNDYDVKAFFDRELAKGNCFIATAAYGSPMAEEVMIFRRFRDEILLKSELGSLAVKTYYMISPCLAAKISNSHVLKTITRQLLQPVLAILRSR